MFLRGMMILTLQRLSRTVSSSCTETSFVVIYISLCTSLARHKRWFLIINTLNTYLVAPPHQHKDYLPHQASSPSSSSPQGISNLHNSHTWMDISISSSQAPNQSTKHKNINQSIKPFNPPFPLLSQKQCQPLPSSAKK